jgi:hypothetical protein
MLLGVAAFAQSPTQQDVDLPCGPPDPNREQYRQQFIDLAKPMEVHLGDLKLKVPFGYIYPRPFSTHVNCPPRTTLGIAFWVPDLRPPEKDIWFEASFRPAESRPSAAGDRSYLVRVPIMRFGSTLQELNSTHPSLQVRNILAGTKSGFKLIPEHGLSRIAPADGVTSQDEWFNLENAQEAILIMCLRSRGVSANPTCGAEVYFDDLKIRLVFHFPRDALPDWRSFVSGARTLVERWRERS